MFRKKDTTQGFTLVEIVVSLAIFAVVAVIALGALLKIVDANKKAQSLKTSINNINYTLDSMSREIRTGGNYYCIAGSTSYIANSIPAPAGCSTGTAPWTFVFYSARTSPNLSGGGNCKLMTAYRYESNTLTKADQQYCTQRISTSGDIDPRPFVPIISPDVVITKAFITVETGDTVTIGQPRVFIHLTGYSGVKEKNKTPFDIQTSISQRIND